MSNGLAHFDSQKLTAVSLSTGLLDEFAEVRLRDANVPPNTITNYIPLISDDSVTITVHDNESRDIIESDVTNSVGFNAVGRRDADTAEPELATDIVDACNN
jgi:hypothetical protein